MKTATLVNMQNGLILFFLFFCTSLAAQDIHRITFDNTQKVIGEMVQAKPLYQFSGNTLFYEEQAYQVIFPADFKVADTAFTFIFFQGRSESAIPQHTLVLVGNYKKDPVLIADYNHNLDFSDDEQLTWKQEEPVFTFELFHSEYKGGRVVIEMEKLPSNAPKQEERFKKFISGLPFSKGNRMVESDYWWNVNRINYKTTTSLVGNDSVRISLVDGTGEGLFSDLNWDRVVIGDHRKEFSFEDVMERGYSLKENLKISIKNKTYNVKEVEPGGKYILLEGSDVKVNRLTEGSLIPNFAFTTTTGAREDLYSLSRGNKWVLLDFWGSWCKPCIANTPRLQAIHEQQKNLTIIGLIAHEKDTKNALSLIEKKKISWLNGFATEEMLKDLRVKGFPRYILLDESHKIVKFKASLTDIEELAEKE